MVNKIKCSHILVQKQNEALAVVERLKNGESFANLAKELSIDRGSAKHDVCVSIARVSLTKPIWVSRNLLLQHKVKLNRNDKG